MPIIWLTHARKRRENTPPPAFSGEFCPSDDRKDGHLHSKLNRCSQIEYVTMCWQVLTMSIAVLTSLGRHVGQFITFHEFVENLILAENR